jgi:hypothetical protein
MENLLIEIPEDIVAHLRLPPRNVEQELKKRAGCSLCISNLIQIDALLIEEP